MNIKPAYAERAWDYYTKTRTLTRDLSFTEAGLRKVFETQIKAGLLPAEYAIRHDEICRRQLSEAGPRDRQIRQVIKA